MLNAIKRLVLPAEKDPRQVQYESGYHAGLAAIEELIAEFNEKAPKHSIAYEEGFLDAIYDHITK